MENTNTVLTVLTNTDETLSASNLPKNMWFDSSTGEVLGYASGDSGVLTLTATSVTGEVSNLNIQFSTTSAVPSNVPLNTDKVYNADTVEFFDLLSTLTSLSTVSTPTLITANQAAALWQILNIAYRHAQDDLFFDNLTIFSPAITNVLFPAGSLNLSQQLEVIAALTALRDVAGGTYSVIRDSDVLRYSRNSYLIGYIHRKLNH